MTVTDLLMIMSFGGPLFVSLLSIGMMLGYRKVGGNDVKRTILALIIGHFSCVFVSNLTVIFFIYQPDYYIYLSSLSFLSLLLSTVFLYNIIYLLTSGDSSKKLSPLHYIIPIVIALTHEIWCWLVPRSVQWNIVVNQVLDMHNNKSFCLFYASKLWIYALYVVIYSILTFKRMPAYRRYINNYSADEEKSSLHWISMIIILALVIIPISFITFLINGKDNIIEEIIIIIANILYVIKLVTIQYNMFTENYVIISKDCKCPPADEENQVNIDKEEFERYMEEKKPYLNPHLKITDILYEFHTCRSYMSAFINRTYGMNFSFYINTLRMKEYEKLKNDPGNIKKSDSELISRAGFSYRGFMRFKKNKIKN
ncbi:hypothetical protein [Prevotella sp. 10(H)]|uniref:hypothetical protein n=1 Tax=Prevotella sp. 10(H) TaxID=1158294 RepID=UPI0004A73875|nr:hypothetical protein [Prevotella sp. 10(H)]